MSCGDSEDANRNRRKVAEVAKFHGVPEADVADVFHELIAEYKDAHGIPHGGGTKEENLDAQHWARHELDQRVEGHPRCPACAHLARKGHQCPPTKLRKFAKAQDAETAALYEKLYEQRVKLDRAVEDMRRAAGQEQTGYGQQRHWDGTIADAAFVLKERIKEAKEAGEPRISGVKSYISVSDAEHRLNLFRERQSEVDQTREEIVKQDAVYAKFGWNRAFLVVTNGQGHVHSSMQCSTCYPTTRFVWLPEYSGDDESQIVDDAGERACSVCYKSAPVETFSKPTKIFSEDEKKAMEAKQAKKVASEAKKAKAIANAATPDGSELVIIADRRTHNWGPDVGKEYEVKERFKTERAAMMWAVDRAMAYYRPLNDTEKVAIDTILGSIAAKRGCDVAEVRAELDKKVAAKKKREGLA